MLPPLCSDGDKLVPSVQKKINELEVGLLHLQQNIDIPEISLPIHPTIQGVVKKASDSGRKPTAEELSSYLGDSTFLNALQKDVSRWIREIQKVSVDCVDSLCVGRPLMCLVCSCGWASCQPALCVHTQSVVWLPSKAKCV